MATLEEPFTAPEVREALAALNGSSAPGLGGISNRLLRNMDEGPIRFLTEQINCIWERGEIPESWKMASVVLIPKLGRTPDMTNLRPILLTLCIGKVAENAIDNRISKHVEGRGLFPYDMIGFRPSLLTQDAMKVIKYQMIDTDTREVRAILGLDIEKAFNTARPHTRFHLVTGP